MCGIFAFITKKGRGPNLSTLKRLAIANQQRGPHAFGLAWVSADGRLHTFKRPGPAGSDLRDLDRCAGAHVVVGHCRWATHGSPQDNRNNHPHRAGQGWFVHNGVVHNYEHLIRRYRLEPHTQCDSEVLGHLIARFAGSLAVRATQTIAVAEGPLALLGAWSAPARLLLARSGNPLHVGGSDAGYYFSSLADGLPTASVVENDSVATFVFDGGRLRCETASLPRKRSVGGPAWNDYSLFEGSDEILLQ